MPAQESYFHIYNRGLEKRVIFNDEVDYQVFLGYLHDYLSTPADPETTKKVFIVNGRSFRGVPHQTKNYYNKVELTAYSLMPNHFHLILKPIDNGSLEGFIRSLFTRYSIYFNKKYQRSGPLFEGPYKSVQIKDMNSLHLLTHHLHHSHGYSSYPEYLGQKETDWVRPKKGTDKYRDFVEKYQLDQKEKELLQAITFDSESYDLTQPPKEEGVDLNPNIKSRTRLPELTTIMAVFVLLVGMGIRNIRVSTAKTSKLSTAPTTSEVLSDSVKTEEPNSKTIVIVEINDDSVSINIRQKPTTQSEKIGEAIDGEAFEFVSVNSGWYEIKLADGSTGFISAKYGQIGETNN